MKHLVPLILLAAGCAPAPSAPGEAPNQSQEPQAVPNEQEPPLHGAGDCDPAPAQKLIGRQRSEALGQEAMKLSGAGRLRWIGPNQAVTMDFSPSRLNIEYDEAGKVIAIRCG